MSNYCPVIGLEIHCQLATKTKMFCGCEIEVNTTPNKHVCPVCLGMPGAMPVPNKKAVEYAIRLGLALNCEIDLNAELLLPGPAEGLPDYPDGRTSGVRPPDLQERLARNRQG